jgi:hypothetical protein
MSAQGKSRESGVVMLSDMRTALPFTGQTFADRDCSGGLSTFGGSLLFEIQREHATGQF